MVASHTSRRSPIPTKPKAHCSYPRCPNFKPCPDHTPKRESATKRGYGGRRWASARATTLRRDPFCTCGPECCPTGCFDVSEVADHFPRSRKELLRAGEYDVDDPKFLRGLSKACHRRETNRLQPGGWMDR